MARRLTSKELVLSRYTDVDEKPTNASLDVDYENEEICPIEEALKEVTKTISGLNLYIKTAKDYCCKSGQYGVTLEESAAIFLYTTEWPSGEKSFYSYFNEAARKNKRSLLKPYGQYLRLLESGLNKLPPIQAVVYRGFKHDATNDYKNKQQFVWRSVSSCSRNVRVLIVNGFLGPEDQGTLFIISAKNAKDIHLFSKFPEENEVMIMPNTKFRVTREAKKENVEGLGTFSVIYLEEIGRA